MTDPQIFSFLFPWWGVCLTMFHALVTQFQSAFASQGHLTSLGSDEKAVMLAFMIGAGCP